MKDTPYFVDLRPGGKYVAKDLHEVGGVPVVMKELAQGRAAAPGLHDRLGQDAGRGAGRDPGEADGRVIYHDRLARSPRPAAWSA